MRINPRMYVAVVFLTGWACLSSQAAERRAWSTLTNCTLIVSANGDGDSFRIRSGNKELNIRLYFVDAPECNLAYPERVLEQSRYFGVSLDTAIAGGVAAKHFTERLLTNRTFTVRTSFAVAGGRSREPRYYSIVELGTNSLAEALVANGWARTKGMVTTPEGGRPSKEVVKDLANLELAARVQRRGIWRSSDYRLLKPIVPP
ncbi:MAG TPA: thermonuclease family protein [Verrucomicrobiota bacterium]|nr:thermonuclease family protein [Verrucomicrobiota bacterium]